MKRDVAISPVAFKRRMAYFREASEEIAAAKGKTASDLQMLRDPLVGYGLAQLQSEEANRETGF